MMRLKITVLALLGVMATMSFAVADSGNLDMARKSFAEGWLNDYQPTQCADNTVRLLKRLLSRNVQLAHAQVITVRPKLEGLLVNAERTRTDRPGVTSEQNWYHHVFLILDGKVFDYDFMDRPSVLPVSKYFSQMFLDEIYPPFYAHNYVGRKEKLGYLVEMYPAEEYLKTGGTSRARSVTTLGKFVESL